MLNPLVTQLAEQFDEVRKTVEHLEKIPPSELSENDYRIIYALVQSELPYFKDQLEGYEDNRFSQGEPVLAEA